MMVDLRMVDLRQKLLILQELGLKAAMRGLCTVSFDFVPGNKAFSVNVYQADVGTERLFGFLVFLDFIEEWEDHSAYVERTLFSLDSAIAFFQGLLDTGRPMVQASEPEEVPVVDESEAQCAGLEVTG